MKNKKLPKYCRKCGSILLRSSKGADEIKVYYYDGMGGTEMVLDNLYDQNTGERNVAEIATCPKRSLWTNSHDKIVLYKNVLHWL